MKILNASSRKSTINDQNQHHTDFRLSVCNVCTSCKLQRFTSDYSVYTMFRSNTNLVNVECFVFNFGPQFE